MTNTSYVYTTRRGDDALVVALNVGDEAVPLSLRDLGVPRAEVVAGSGAPPAEVVTETVVPAHGWLILAPR